MEYRIPRKNFNKDGIDKTFPNVCIVCRKKSDKGCYADIHYHSAIKTNKETDRMIIRMPLCSEHSKIHDQGKKQARISMWLLLSSILPFFIGVILMETLVTSIPGYSLIIVAIILMGFGFFFWTPSNKALKESREKVHVKLITGNQVILEIKDEQLAMLLEKTK